MASPYRDGSGINDLQLRSLEQKLQVSRTRSLWSTESSATIFRVPSHLRRIEEDAYGPKIVSIGPYHRHEAPAASFEEAEHLKWKFLDRLLASTPDQRIEHYLWRMKQLEEFARRCYSEQTDMDSDNFAEMLLLDGCFIVHLLWAFRDGYQGNNSDLESESMREAAPRLGPITYDLLQLENQIPFFILQEIYHLFIPTHLYPDKPELVWLAFSYFRNCIPLIKTVPGPYWEENYHHLLHVFHSFLRPGNVHPLRVGSRRRISTVLTRLLGSKPAKKGPKSIPTAMKLRDAGIKFRDDAKLGPTEATFRNGTIHMLCMEMYDHTGPLLQNLIAFEQCLMIKERMWVTSYACFVDELVDTPEDVALLQREGVIVNWVGSEEEIAGLFNRMCKKVMFSSDKSHLKALLEDVNRYYNSRWPRWRAKLARDYFGNPWTILSLVAAMILLFLTVIQTFFAVLSYVRPP